MLIAQERRQKSSFHSVSHHEQKQTKIPDGEFGVHPQPLHKTRAGILALRPDAHRSRPSVGSRLFASVARTPIVRNDSCCFRIIATQSGARCAKTRITVSVACEPVARSSYSNQLATTSGRTFG